MPPKRGGAGGRGGKGAGRGGRGGRGGGGGGGRGGGEKTIASKGQGLSGLFDSLDQKRAQAQKGSKAGAQKATKAKTTATQKEKRAEKVKENRAGKVRRDLRSVPSAAHGGCLLSRSPTTLVPIFIFISRISQKRASHN